MDRPGFSRTGGRITLTIAAIQSDVEKHANCGAKHVESVSVREMFGNQVAWEGVIEVFDLTAHSKANKAYAWMRPNDGQTTIVLGINPPVDSASSAVRLAFASGQMK